MSQRIHLCRGKNAFTLIELLVVISIISLLIAILLPALKSARDTAQKVKCLAQLRQWSLAQNAYANDFREALPSGENWGATYIDAYVGLYMGDSKGSYRNIQRMMQCPSKSTYVHGQSGAAAASLAWGYRVEGEYAYWGGNGAANQTSLGDWADIGWRYPTYFRGNHKPTPSLNHKFVYEVGASKRVVMADMTNYSESAGVRTYYQTASNVYVNHANATPNKPSAIHLLYVDGHASPSPAWTDSAAVYHWGGGRGRMAWVP